MGLVELPTELILDIALRLPQSDLAHLLQVHRSLYNLLLPNLYQRHVREERLLQRGLFWCATTSNEAAVSYFLDNGANVNASMGTISMRHAKLPFQPWFDVQTPLSVAANTGNDKLVALLISRGAKVHGFPSTAWGKTQPPVVDALLSGRESTVRLLLMHESPIHDPDMEQGGLVNCAISRGQISLLKLLVEFGVDLNIPWQKIYPLTRAVSARNISTDIVQFLLDNGADINLANDPPGHLLDQAMYGTIDTLRLLLDRGATYPRDKLDRAFEIWVDTCTVETAHAFREHGYAPSIETLSVVVRIQRADILQFFIDSGVDLNERDKRGSTLVHTAISRCAPRDPPTRSFPRSQVCRRPARKSLVRKIEPVPQQVAPTCMSDKVEITTPEEVLRSLICGGVDLNVEDARGRTPLALAKEYGCSLLVQQMLVDGGAK